MPKHAKYTTGALRPASVGLTEAQRATATRIGGTVAAGTQKALDAVSLLSPEQRAWLTRRDDAPAALEDAVRQAMTAVPPSLSSMTVEQLHELREAISKELRETYRASATRTQDGKRKQQEATR